MFVIYTKLAVFADVLVGTITFVGRVFQNDTCAAVKTRITHTGQCVCTYMNSQHNNSILSF